MSRVEWIKEMIAEKKTEEEIVAALLAGNGMKGVKPMTGERVEMFAKLNYKKVLKKVQSI